MWSIGVMAYAVLCGKMPFNEDDPKKMCSLLNRFVSGEMQKTEDEHPFSNEKF